MGNYFTTFASALAMMAGVAMATCAVAATGDSVVNSQIDPAPCISAATARDEDAILAACGALVDSEKTAPPDRIRALISRAGAHERKGHAERAIADYDSALKLDPTLADIFNARGELWRKKGDLPRALADFGAAIKLSPQHEPARANYKALALELERIGAQMAIKNKPIGPLK
jgi:tetratricopeptide (TPR) repeat protein